MNRRHRLLQRIERYHKRTRDPVLKRILEDTKQILLWDEDEITDLISRCDILERGMNGILPYFPDVDDSDKYIPPTL